MKIYGDGFRPSLALHKKGSIIKPVVQDKPWGAEIWLVYTSRYAMKQIIVERGARLSLQKHRKKMETMLVVSGKAAFTIGTKKIIAQAGDVVHVDPKTAHRVEAKAGDVELWEVSSPELGDIVRLADDYGR